MNFFHTAPASAHPPIHGIPSAFVNRTSNSSHSSSNFEEPERNDERTSRLIMDAVVEKVYVAVPSDSKKWKANFLWVLQKIPRTKTIVILHIHCPARDIPFMGAYFPAEHVAPAELASFRRMEAREMNQKIAKYQAMCSRVKVKTELLITTMEHVAEGILTLISQHGITELVMGAAADKHYSKLLKVPTSTTAITVQQHAHQACKIWFLCKGNVICTREAVSVRQSLHESHRTSSSWMSSLLSADSSTFGSRTTSFDSSTGNSVTILPSTDNRPNLLDSSNKNLWDSNTLSSESSRSTGSHVIETDVKTTSLSGQENSADYVPTRPHQTDIAGFSTLNHYLNDVRENKEIHMHFHNLLSEPEKLHHEAYMEILRCHKEVQDKDKTSKSAHGEQSAMNFFRAAPPSAHPSTKGKPSAFVKQGNSADYVPTRSRQSDIAGFSTLNHYVNGVGVNKEMYMDFHNMLSEAEKLRHEAYEESFRCQKEEQDEDKASVKSDDSLYPRNVIKKREQKTQIQQTTAHSYEEIRRERDEMIGQLRMVQEKTAQLELELINCKNLIEEFQEKLSEAHCMLSSLEQEQERLRQGRDSATREIQQLRSKIMELENPGNGVFAEFTYAELQDATNNFHDSLKIGEGGYGSVYKGVIRSTDVAIKLLNPQGMQGTSEFHKEMEVLSKVRHPHLVTLIGTCPEAWALVYEFLPNGNLEDRLTCKGDTPPLTWQARCRIAAEICSALVFLHTLKPFTVIHGDLKPANILLDANFISRLGDFGICRLLEADASTILFRCTHPMGTFAYMDPEFVASGELRPSSDVYAFGIILLRLLTGRQAMGIINKVRDAVDGEMLQSILDESAGEWPFDLAMQFAELGLKCCEIKRKNRPDLGKEAWEILEPLMTA